MAGHLLLRARRAAHALRLRDRPRRRPLSVWPPPSSETRSSSSRSTRSPTAGTASRGSTGSSSSSAGLPGDTVRARVTKVQRRHAEAIATEVLTPGPQRVEAPCAHYPACGGCRFQDLAYDVQVATKGSGSPTRSSGSPASPTCRSSRSSRRASQFGYRNKMEYSFTQLDGRADARPAPGGPLGRGARDREVLADDRPRQRDSQPHARLGARGEAARLRPGDRTRDISATSSFARGATPARRSCSS